MGEREPVKSLEFEGFFLDSDGLFRLRQDGCVEPVPLGSRALDLLRLLVERPGEVVAKDAILQIVWRRAAVEESNLTVQVSTLRRVLDQQRNQGSCIQTLPGRGYRFTSPVTRSLRDKLRTPALPLPEKPAIAVLPFQNLTGDPGQEYFADGMVEEIITALSRIRWLFVVARNSSFTYKGQILDIRRVGQELGVGYLLEGSVQKSAGRVRITAQLVETESGAHLWADRFDGSLKDVFALQEQVATAVAGAIEPTLETAEVHKAAQHPTSDPTAYDLYLQALPNWISWERDRVVLALTLLDQATTRDQRYAPALAMAAWCHLLLDNNNWTDDSAGNRSRAIRLARAALQITAEDPIVLANAAFVLGYFGEDIDASIRLVERALELNPSFAFGWLMSGFLRLWAGHGDAAIFHLQRSMRLNPRGHRAFHLTGVGIAHFFNRRFDKALTFLLISMKELPSYVATYRFAAACYGHLGRAAEAAEMIERVRELTQVVVPDAGFYRDRQQRDLYLSGLWAAMHPEA